MKRQKHAKINAAVLLTSLLVSLASMPVLAETNLQTPQQVLDRAAKLGETRHFREAMGLLEAGHQRNPDNFALTTALQEAYWLAPNPAGLEALLAEQNASPLTHVFEQAYLSLGPLAGEDPTSQSGVLLMEQVQQALALEPSAPETLYLQGRQAWQQGNTDPAEAFFLGALTARAHFLPAQQALTALYAQRHQTHLATETLMPILEEAPRHLDTLYLIGRVFLDKGDPGQALVYFQQAKNLSPRPMRQLLRFTAIAEEQLGKRPAGSPTER